MTESAISKLLFSLVPVPAIKFVSVVDPNVQSSLINLGTFVVATVGTLAGAWIAYRQAQLKKTVDVLEKNTNSMKDALVASTAKTGHLEGFIEGVEKAETKAAVIAVAEAAGAVRESQKQKTDEKSPSS